MKIPPVVSDYTGTGSTEKLGDLDGTSPLPPPATAFQALAGLLQERHQWIFGQGHETCCICYQQGTL